MASKSKAAAGAQEPKNERLALAAAIASVAQKGDAWLKSMENFKTLRQDTLTHLETELQAFKRQREEAEQEFEQSKRSKRIGIEQELSEFGYQAALKILADRKEVAIGAVDLEQLRGRLRDLEQKGDADLKHAVEEERSSAQKALAFEKRTLQLQHEKEIASLTSQVEALNKQLISAKTEIDKAEARLDSQRELCRSIAESCKQPAIVQNMGK